MAARSIVRGLWCILLSASTAVGLSACIGDPQLGNEDLETLEEQTDTAVQPLVILGTVTQQSHVASGWMTSEATLRDDGVIVGWTELKTSDSVFGFTGETAIALVDKNKQPLTYVVAGSWGINACFWSCPRTRTVFWSPSVSASDWANIKDDVRGMAIIQRHDPKDSFWDWVWAHKSDIISLAALF